MNLFGSKAPNPSPQEVARQEASIEAVKAGGLPLNAVDRLSNEAQRQESGNPFFTSDLSPSELLLTHECGFLPLGQVMGSSVYSVGFQYLGTGSWYYSSGELAVLTGAQMEARRLAFDRLRQEAKLLRADGVVGVRLIRKQEGLDAGMIEFQAIGTAVRRVGAPPLAPGHEPFVSALSGQDHWMLRKAGFGPCGFVYGCCVWYQYPDWRSQGALMSWGNCEVTSVTQGLYNARELAQIRMEEDAFRVGGRGIVGVHWDWHMERLEQENQPPSFIFHFTVLGTAIRSEEPMPAPTAKLVVDLKDYP